LGERAAVFVAAAHLFSATGHMTVRIDKFSIQIEQVARTTRGTWRALCQGSIASGVSHLAGGLFLGSVWGTALVHLVPPPAGPNTIELTAAQVVVVEATIDNTPQPMRLATLGIETAENTTGSIPLAERQLRPDIGKMPPSWSIAAQAKPMETELVRGLEQATPRLETEPLKKRIHLAERVMKPTSTPPLKKAAITPPALTSDVLAAPAIPSTQQQGQDTETPPQRVYSPAPTYPARALRQGLTGRVVLRVHLDAEGNVVSTRVRTSSGHAILDEAALASVRLWRFQPARQLGVAIEQIIAVPITFRIDRTP
jgi:protein TonB